MKEWFACRSVNGNLVAGRTAAVEAVAQKEGGIVLHFRSGDVATDTYDLVGFIANVLEDEALEALVTDPDRSE